MFAIPIISLYKNTMKQPRIYWEYETNRGENLTVSIRMRPPIDTSLYKQFILDFIEKHEDRIDSVLCTEELYNGSLCTIVYMDSMDPVNHPNKM